jgi:hypothetical protein
MKKSLSVPEVLAEQKGWDEKYLGAVIHSIQVSDNDAEEKQDLIEEFLGRETSGLFRATNPYSKRIFLPHLIERLLQRFEPKSKKQCLENPRGADKTVFIFVTITDWRWATCDNNIQFDLAKAKQKVRNALGGTDHLVRFEAALYTNVTHEHNGTRGKLVLFHGHALVWGSSLSKLKRLRESVRHRFVAPPGTKTSMKLKRVRDGDVPKVVGYIAKLPVLGYRAVRTEERNPQVKARLGYATLRYATPQFALPVLHRDD